MNGATCTGANSYISIFSGNTITDLVVGSNQTLNTAAFAGTDDIAPAIPVYRLSLAGTTTVYLKFRCNFSAGTPTALAGRLSARRVR